MLNKYVGYHGTDKENVQSILKNNFKRSMSPDEWLGHGAYFFVDGISCPIENAREWAKNEAHENGYSRYSVLKALASGFRILDLTTIDGLAVFDKVRERIIEKYIQHFRLQRIIYEDDSYILGLVIKSTRADIIISNLYIKNKIQRVKRIFSRIPNSTVMVVINPANSIDLNSIEEIESGSI